jgi:hypothetical protein
VKASVPRQSRSMWCDVGIRLGIGGAVDFLAVQMFVVVKIVGVAIVDDVVVVVDW